MTGRSKRKAHKVSYDRENPTARSFGRGAVHIHVLIWLKGEDLTCLQDVLSGETPGAGLVPLSNHRRSVSRMHRRVAADVALAGWAGVSGPLCRNFPSDLGF